MMYTFVLSANYVVKRINEIKLYNLTSISSNSESIQSDRILLQNFKYK